MNFRVSDCLCWTVSETMTVMQFKGDIGWSQGKERKRERLSGSEWKGNRGGGKKTKMKRHRRMEMTSSDSPESQWVSLNSKCIELRTLGHISEPFARPHQSEVALKTHLWCGYQCVILWLAWRMQTFSVQYKSQEIFEQYIPFWRVTVHCSTSVLAEPVISSILILVTTQNKHDWTSEGACWKVSCQKKPFWNVSCLM